MLTWACPVLQGCANSAPIEVDESTKVENRYPVGSDRAAVVARVGDPRESEPAAEVRGRDMRAFFRSVERSSGRRVARYDVYDVTRRLGRGSLAAACRQFDYVFYDEADRVLAVVTRHGTC